MSERYSKLFASPQNLYSEGAPVLISAGALLKDNQTGKVLAQLKIRNIQDNSIKATTVKITPFDTAGKPLGGTVEYQYLDLSASRDTDFGQKTPVSLPDASTRAFSVSVLEVIFADNTVWTASESVWEPLSAPIPLEQALEDSELAKQYRIQYGENCKCIFKQEKDLWRCACGALNFDNEESCHKCGLGVSKLAEFDVSTLKAEAEHRLAAETARKRLKAISMVIGIAFIAFGGFVAYDGYRWYFIRQRHDMDNLFMFLWGITAVVNGLWCCVAALLVKTPDKHTFKRPLISSAILAGIMIFFVLAVNLL